MPGAEGFRGRFCLRAAPSFCGRVCPSGIPRPRHNASLPWAGGIAPVLTLWLHRFASLGLKSRIDARIAPVLTFWLHRFASLGLKSRIDARIAPDLTSWLHRFASLGLKSRITAVPSCRQVEWPACAGVVATVPRPILIFVVSKKNSPPAAVFVATVRVRF